MSPRLRSWARAEALAEERGNASVEFIGWTVMLVVPVLYLIVALSQIQAASFAVVSAADAATRVLEVDTSDQAVVRAHAAAGLALSDQGIDVDPASAVSLECAGTCAQGAVLRVEVGVDLPGLGAIGAGRQAVVVHAQRAVDFPEEE